MIKKIDLFIIIGILLISLACFFIIRSDNGDGYAVIEIDGESYRTIILNRDDDYYLELETVPAVVLRVHKGKICFHRSECPDKICIGFGEIGDPGQVAVCVPAKVSIRIVGKPKIDAITGS